VHAMHQSLDGVNKRAEAGVVKVVVESLHVLLEPITIGLPMPFRHFRLKVVPTLAKVMVQTDWEARIAFEVGPLIVRIAS